MASTTSHILQHAPRFLIEIVGIIAICSLIILFYYQKLQCARILALSGISIDSFIAVGVFSQPTLQGHKFYDNNEFFSTKSSRILIITRI